MNNDNWFSKNEHKVEIDSSNVYQALYSQVQTKINQNLSIPDILGWIEAEVKTAYKAYNETNPSANLTQGAINNCRGRWNEFMITSFLAQIAIDLYSSGQLYFVPFNLPNSKSSNKFLELFNHNEFEHNQGLYAIKQFKDKIFFPVLTMFYQC